MRQVFDFCLEGANFPKIFPERVTPLGKIDIADLRIEQGREFRFRHWMFGFIGQLDRAYSRGQG